MSTVPVRDWTTLLQPSESTAIATLGVQFNAVIEEMLLSYRTQAMQNRIRNVHTLLTDLSALPLAQQEAIAVSAQSVVSQLTAAVAPSNTA